MRVGRRRLRRNQDRPFVLQNHLIVLVERRRLDAHDARFAAAPAPTEHQRLRAQRITRIHRSQKLHVVVTEMGNRLLRIVLHTQTERDVEHHQRRHEQIGKATRQRVLAVEIQRIGLHERASKFERKRRRNGQATRMLKGDARFKFLQKSAETRIPDLIERNQSLNLFLSTKRVLRHGQSPLVQRIA